MKHSLAMAGFAVLASQCLASGVSDSTKVKLQWGLEAGMTWMTFPDQKALCDPTLPAFMAAFYNDKPTETKVGNRQAFMLGGFLQYPKGAQLGLSIGWQSYRGQCHEWQMTIAPWDPSIGVNSICMRADYMLTTQGARRPSRMRASVRYGGQLSGRVMSADYNWTMPFYGSDVRFTTTAEARAFHLGLGPAIALGLQSARSTLGISAQMNLVVYATGNWTKVDDRVSISTGPELSEEQGSFSEFLLPDRLGEYGLFLNSISLNYRYVLGKAN
jgi:hypothetical protein